MLRNYIKIAFRNLNRYRFISFINLFGLTVGLTCCLLILNYIVNELSYDKFNPEADNIYRVTRSFNTPGGVDVLHLSAVAPPFAGLLKNDFPDIKEITQVLSNGNLAVKYEEKLFNEQNAFFADDKFFQFFPVQVIRGNAQKALTEPYSIMLTEKLATKYFGNEDPVNKMIKIDNLPNQFKVTGIYKELPVNSHMHPELLLSFNTLKDPTVYGEQNLKTNWGNNAFHTYLLFPENYPVQKIANQFPAFLDKHVHFPGEPADAKASKGTKLFLQKLTDIHLRSHLADELEENGDIKRVYIFTAIGLFILLIACINYMNLSTARSIVRAKEIGVRKAIGAQRKELISQFLTESVLITIISLVLAVIATSVLLPFINKIAGQESNSLVLLHWQFIIPLVILPVFIGLMSGIYPALFMSSFDPVKVLKGVGKIGTRGISFRQVLVVVQFSISIILIVSTIVVFQQLKYLQNTSLGFNKEHILTMRYNFGNNYDSFRNELLRSSNIVDAGRSSRIPSGRLLDEMDTKVFEKDQEQPVKISLKVVAVDYDFIPTYGIGVVAGRNFSREHSTDTTNFVLNETAVSKLGWGAPQNAIGKDIMYGGVRGKVIGVAKDFHFESMHEKIVPLIMSLPPERINPYGRLSVKIKGNNIQAAIAEIETKWHKYLPETPFEYTFLNERFDRLYKSEQQQGKVFTIFACIAVFIACLGLFGLSAFAISQRIKEIGIRKVLGASIPEIVKVLSIDFLKLVIIAAIIAFPVAWYTMHQWLQEFAYRISIQWWVLAISGIAAILIALITISFQSIKAAMANPVKSLRSE